MELQISRALMACWCTVSGRLCDLILPRYKRSVWAHRRHHQLLNWGVVVEKGSDGRLCEGVKLGRGYYVERGCCEGMWSCEGNGLKSGEMENWMMLKNV